MRNSGPLTLLRTTNDYEDGRHRVYKRAFKTKAMEVPVPAGRENGNGHKKLMKPNDTWYLHKYEGLGFLSTLMREGYAHMHRTTPGIPATLESSSTRSRDRYAHLGFELMEPQTILGSWKGPRDKNHARKQKEELTGVPYYNMVNWDPSKSLGHKKKRRKSSSSFEWMGAFILADGLTIIFYYNR
ncbi:hypothetical protein BT96DRAFT_915107 [Gymnopus androsaceus JB14]|uniref:Uncharacterized protein n=1 Tax=Gymnopus androsaceus JB14 TaxID=1447944 RepID=A0A6A4I9X7_9AGAR|nr:hypothetical protein BT96DRAFT_915107 [Gymnopus androsaceus JB14]